MVLNLVGSKAAASAQNLIVGVLVLVMILFLGWPAPIGDQPAQFDLLADLCRFARAHVLVLREGGIFPPQQITVLGEPTVLGALALALASRLASVWGASLSAVVRTETDAAQDAIVQAEAALEERIGEMARAEVWAVPAATLEEAVSKVSSVGRLVVVPAPDEDVDAMVELMRQIAASNPGSLLLVRAHGARPIEIWMHE